MENNKILHFITEKVEDLEQAIFYCYSKGPLKINNTIIRTSKVDVNGCISFFIKRPTQSISEFEQEFPVGLNYFKKGKEYSLNIFGKARIIDDPEELAYDSELTMEEINCALTTHILVKVKIINAEVFDNNFEKKNLLLKKVLSVLARFFDSVGAASRRYNFSTDAPLQHFGF